jgi:hypothetical protein
MARERNWSLFFDGFTTFQAPEYEKAVFGMPSVCMYAHTEFWWESQKKRDHVGWRVILIWITKKEEGVV